MGLESIIQGFNSSVLLGSIYYYTRMERIYIFTTKWTKVCVIMMISAMCRESWQFEFWHVSSESLCEARNVFPRVLKKRGAEVDVKVLSFVSYFSFSLLISLISLT